MAGEKPGINPDDSKDKLVKKVDGDLFGTIFDKDRGHEMLDGGVSLNFLWDPEKKIVRGWLDGVSAGAVQRDRPQMVIRFDNGAEVVHDFSDWKRVAEISAPEGATKVKFIALSVE